MPARIASSVGLVVDRREVDRADLGGEERVERADVSAIERRYALEFRIEAFVSTNEPLSPLEIRSSLASKSK